MTTVAEKRHMSRVAELGCVVCRNLGHGPTPAELHHPRTGVGKGQRSSNMDVLPICPFHHRLGGHGEAFHSGQKTWQAKYGTEAELLEQTRREMGILEN